MTEEQLVSAIIATKDRQSHLEDAIGSVATQTYDPIELIVVDGSEEPITERRIRTLCSVSNVSVVCDDANEGVAAARNTGIDHADGAYLAFLDDDDLWHESKITKQVTTFRRSNNNLGLVYTGDIIVNETDTVVGVERPVHPENATRYLLSGGLFPPTSTYLVRSDVPDSAGMWDTSIPIWEDREWAIRISQHFDIAALPNPLVLRKDYSPNRLSQDYERAKRIAHPTLRNKYTTLAAEYDCRREFLAYLDFQLGHLALHTGHYSEATRYLGRSVRRKPFNPKPYPYLGVAIGGTYAFRAGKLAKKFKQPSDDTASQSIDRN